MIAIKFQLLQERRVLNFKYRKTHTFTYTAQMLVLKGSTNINQSIGRSITFVQCKFECFYLFCKS